jgi:ribosomal protein L6P/L9E
MNQNNLEIDIEIAKEIEDVMENDGHIYPKTVEDKLAAKGYDEKEVRETMANLRAYEYIIPSQNYKGRLQLRKRFTES